LSDFSLDDDVLSFSGVKLVVQRLGLEAWQAHGGLRSWDIAPLHREGGELLVPCSEHEALWLGITCDDGVAGVVSFTDELSGGVGGLTLPDDYQLGSLVRAGEAKPIRLEPNEVERRLRLDVRLEHQRSLTLIFKLVTPQAWSARSRRAPPGSLERPPLPPLLG
jgi:hypothetical protein